MKLTALEPLLKIIIYSIGELIPYYYFNSETIFYTVYPRWFDRM